LCTFHNFEEPLRVEAVRPFQGLEGRVIVEQYKGRGRQAGAAPMPRPRYDFFYRLFMRCVFGSRRMRL
jgi:hypothetical protein